MTTFGARTKTREIAAVAENLFRRKIRIRVAAMEYGDGMARFGEASKQHAAR